MSFPRLRNLLIVVAGLLFGATQQVAAEPLFSPSCLIQSSPFYQRLLSAGVFNIEPIHVDSQQPVQLLFRIARGLRYNSDHSKTDKWQSADETTRNYGGDCEDKAIWLYTQMRRNGFHETALHIGKYAPSSKKFHMWVSYVDEAGRTILMDPTIQIKPWEVSRFSEKNYKSSHILTGDDCVSF